MHSVATDGVAWSVCRSVCLSRPWALQKRLNRSKCRLGCGRGWSQYGNVEGEKGRPKTCPVMFDGRYIPRHSAWQNRYGADANCGVLDRGAHWRHVANTIELSVRGGDAALRQITLITCYCGCPEKRLNPSYTDVSGGAVLYCTLPGSCRGDVTMTSRDASPGQPAATPARCAFPWLPRWRRRRSR